MFETLSERLGAILDKLTRRGALTESDVVEAMREVRRALLEADVALDVVKSFTDKVKAKAVGQDVVRSVTPGQMVVKIVHDELVAMLGSDAKPIDLTAPPPVGMMMVGLQGSGKTTTTAKIAKRLESARQAESADGLARHAPSRRARAAPRARRADGRRDAADHRRPDALSRSPRARQGREARRLRRRHLDTAGRTHIDEELMARDGRDREGRAAA